MASERSPILGVAARSGRLGWVLLEERQLVCWGTSQKGAASPRAAARLLQRWIDDFDPSVLVTENPDATRHKGKKQRAILAAFMEVARDRPLRHHAIGRNRRRANIYRDAEGLVNHFPELAAQVPKKPQIWVTEPYRLVYFEALLLVRDAGLLEEERAE